MDKVYAIFEITRARKSLFEWTEDQDKAINELNRLFHLDPFTLKSGFSLEILHYIPSTGVRI